MKIFYKCKFLFTKSGADGSPDKLPPKGISVNMVDGSHYNGIIITGRFREHSRIMPPWLRPGQIGIPDFFYFFILLKSGHHFDGVLNPENVPSSHDPDLPHDAELHIVHKRSGISDYFTTEIFHKHTVSWEFEQRYTFYNPGDDLIYVRLRGGCIYSAILNKYTPVKKRLALIVEAGTSTSERHEIKRKE